MIDRLPKVAAGLLIPVAALALTAEPGSAQDSFEGCYVERTGVVYRIDPGGILDGDLPTECRNSHKHVQFSLTDGTQALASLTTVTVEAEQMVPDGTSAQVRAECPDGTILTGGGANAFGGIGVARILSFGPVAGLSEVYGATMSNSSGSDLTLRATAICLVLPS